jgi:ribonucleoside-diphosphate reductase alpha chain
MTTVTDVSSRSPARLPISRRFTTPGRHPYDEVEWETRTASIAAEDGKTVFEQQDVEVPKEWSQRATNVVASKYFRGPLVAGSVVHHERGEIKRERSVRELIDRVVGTITAWGRKDGYFADDDEAEAFEAELAHIILHQKATFNSPVWFNVGVEERPQCSACFILSVEDTMDSILDWCRTEGMIFKGGSGSGVNLSRLRSSREPLSTGGLASGPVSFMRGADAIAGSIKSGGKTRRAAKMVILNADHPDIVEFIDCKSKEERKAYALGEAGYDLSLDGEAWTSIQFQNANNSVRVTDDFMRAALDEGKWTLKAVTTGQTIETLPARDLLRKIAEAACHCGDPGMQFDTTINDWHTCPESGRINASNPCSEYMHLDNSACNLASLNLMKFLDESGEFDVESFLQAVTVMITAQEIIVGNAGYPTELIGENANKFRALCRRRHGANDRQRLRRLRAPRHPYGAVCRVREEPRIDARCCREAPAGAATHRRGAGPGAAVRGSNGGLGRGVLAGHGARLSQRPGQRPGADRHHRLHDGLRHDGR